jgi:ribose transport system substrate-binding protein
MNTQKRSVIASLCLAVALLCPVALFAQGTTKKMSVGLVLINLQAKFFNDINAGAQDAAKKAGVTLQVIDGNNDPSAQVNAVETLTQHKVDGIIMVAIDVKGILPALQDAAKTVSRWLRSMPKSRIQVSKPSLGWTMPRLELISAISLANTSPKT